MTLDLDQLDSRREIIHLATEIFIKRQTGNHFDSNYCMEKISIQSIREAERHIKNVKEYLKTGSVSDRTYKAITGVE